MLTSLASAVSTADARPQILPALEQSDGRRQFQTSNALGLRAKVNPAAIMLDAVNPDLYRLSGAVNGLRLMRHVTAGHQDRRAVTYKSLEPASDGHELQRWTVNESVLPKDVGLRNQFVPVWRRYPWMTAAVALMFVVQSGLIVALLYENRQRRHAQAEMNAYMNQMWHMNRQATAGELSATIAHELNQPLGAALANVETVRVLLDTSAPDIEQIKEIVTNVKSNTERASQILFRLRRLLKKSLIDQQTVDLNREIADVLRFVSIQASANNVTITEIFEPQPLYILGDPIQLQQVVLNLVLNGIEAIREADKLRRRVTVRTTRLNGALAEITISDSGTGIPQDSLEHIFEPFFTTKEHGMGMGLSIVRSIIESHGGSIHAENQIGGGSVFCVRLPLAQPSSCRSHEPLGPHS